MDNWDDLRFLLAVSKTGSMSGAARILGTNIATVSRRIERLTDLLGMPPFQKTPRGWETNPMVRGLIEVAENFEGHLGKELNAVSVPRNTRAVVRIGAPPIISSQILFPSLLGTEGRMAAIAPEFSDRIGGIGLGDHDIVIAESLPDSGRLLSRKVGSMNFRLYAPSGYFGDGWISLSESVGYSGPNDLGMRVMGSEPVARTSTFMQMFELAMQNRLATVLPDVLARKHPDLVAIGKPEDQISYDFYVLYHETRKGDPVIEATLEWIGYAFNRAKGHA